MPSRVSSLFAFSVSFLVLFFALPALAGNWGENWGEMTWGEVIAAVPTVGWLGGGLLVGLLAGLGLRRIRRPSKGLVLLLALAYAPAAEAQMTQELCALVGGAWDAGTSTCSAIPVSLPHTFVDRNVADAAAMNENFEAFSVSVPHTFENGTTANADEVNANFQALKGGVDQCSDNLIFLFALGDQQACANVGGTWDAVAGSCAAPPCDETSNDATICTNAGGSWDGDSCIAAPTPESNDNMVCTSAGGTWEAGTSTCTPAPAASSYNCFVAGFCAKAAIDYPPGVYGYANVYEGHTPGTEPALGAGCNLSPGSSRWLDGFSLISSFYVLFPPDSYLQLIHPRPPFRPCHVPVTRRTGPVPLSRRVSI